ncbi:uncharacterized protein LOC132447909 isoform X2 [Gadus macrocephalus]|uniref:uncharacterized protein LOC132447909 isoform X2 n=1 Tax=Gadus macrocephalus TaxID=80720 RepID=UPI0028CB90AA|nr:uncharacterized protein LOC132447909 isoform X2 [Gadus macrocephalus]XP_059894911.1 uncharacterized protein LOC132447909 isoform X2 [Gadus macrocephalus]XP_059894912.1 uncharacterized protein LOC132447909 isoform X2 [Gadus macrocephalus]
MAESHQMGFLVLFLSFLPTESTIGILNSINDLKKIPFGQSVPKHSLVLLHWFANAIELSNNNRLKLNFDPNHGDYGAHQYGNFQGFLDLLPFGHRYFTLGNIHFMNNNESRCLPNYYTNDLNYLLVGEELNRARIIFALSSQNTIHRVYITQHYQADQGQGTEYDPEHTYRISINLLRELRVFSLDRREQSELSEIGIYFGSSIGNNELSLLENTWCQLACFGLLFFIVINQRYLPCRPNRDRDQNRPPKRRVRSSSTPQSMMYYPPYHPIYGLQAARQNRDNKLCITIASLTLAFIGAMIIIAVCNHLQI